MRFGEELREQRERRGISLSDVAVATRVSLRYLSALEESRFAELPGGVFSKGIVRSYANCCGLDAEGTLQKFLEAMRAGGIPTEQKDDDWIEFAEAVRRNRTTPKSGRRLRWLGVLLMLLVVVALAAGVVWLLVDRGIVQLPPEVRSLLMRFHKS